MAGPVVFPRPGGVVGGKYVLEALLDGSAAGAVFRARHANTGRPFAIRWLTRTARSGTSAHPASHEPVQVAEHYQNPIILSPLDVGRTPHGTYIVMEWLNGETLASRLACDGAMTPSAAAKILGPCLRAVHDMHLEHAVHGDLRPGNIFICRGVEQHPESVRVFDYSIAGANSLFERMDADGVYTRDAHFLAPEQLTHSPVDHRADVYAFGVLLYVCVTGQLPFPPERSDDFARWVYGQDPPALPGAPGITPALYKLLARAMARDAGARFDSCLELADSLEELALQSERTVVSIQPTRVIRSARPTIRLASELPLPLPAAKPPSSLRATARMPVVSVPAPALESTGADVISARTVSISSQPPAANDNAHSRPISSRAPAISVPPPAARSVRPSGPRSTHVASPPPAPSPVGPLQPFDQRPTVMTSPLPAADTSWPISAARIRRSSRPPMPPAPEAATRSPDPSFSSPPPAHGSPALRWSPSPRMRTQDASYDQPPAPSPAPRLRSRQPLPKLESTLPLEVLRPQDYRKPVSRSLLLGSACLLVFGIFPTVAYFTPPVRERAAVSSTPNVSQTHAAAALPAPEMPAPELPAPQPPAPEKAENPAMVLQPAAANTRKLVDDPSTPIDESDPLISAALAAQEPAAPEASTHKTEVADEELVKKSSPAPKPVVRASNPTAPAAQPLRRPPPALRPPPTSSLTAEPYTTTPAKRLPWETPSPRKH